MVESSEKIRVRSGNAPTVGGERLSPDEPVLEGELVHRKVFRVAGREATAKRECRSCYEAVRLRKCAPASGEHAPPLSGLPAFNGAQRDDSKPDKERASLRVLARPESPDGLLDVDRTRIRRVARTTKREQPPTRVRATAKEVDEDGRVEEDRRHYPTRRSSARRWSRTQRPASSSHS